MHSMQEAAVLYLVCVDLIVLFYFLYVTELANIAYWKYSNNFCCKYFALCTIIGIIVMYYFILISSIRRFF